MPDPSLVKTISQKVGVAGVTDIVATEIVPDVANGGFVRVLRIYGEPPGAPVLEVELRSPSADDIKLTTPGLDY